MSTPLNPRILIGLLLALSSCSSSNNDMPQPPKTQPQQPSKAQPRVPSNVPSQGDRGVSAPPKGARFTIYAGKVDGDLHVERANRVRDTLKSSTKMPDWYVLHETGRSLLYYGYYPSLDDARAKQDRQKIDLMTDQLGNRPFQQALLVELASPDPTAPPEWNLVNTNGYYTVQIAVYKGTPERKQAAVDTVREARKQGIDAYYYHGETASLVCVGVWPQSAVEVTDNVASARGTDRNQPLLVVPGTSDPELNQQFEDVARRGNLQLVRPQVKIHDPTLEATLNRFPRNAVNGMETKRNVNGEDVYEHSLIRRVPTAPEAGEATSGPPGANQPGYNPGYRPELPRAYDPPPQQGGLRSIGRGG